MGVDIQDIEPDRIGAAPAATFSVDRALHPTAAILRTCYALADIATFDMKTGADTVSVQIYPAVGNSTATVVERFRASLIDFSLREDIETRTKGMRDLIWQTAFGEMERRG